MTNLIFDKYDNFITQYEAKTGSLNPDEIKAQLPRHHETNEKIKGASKRALEDLDKWTKPPTGILGFFSKGFHKVKKFLKITKKELTPTPADSPHEFQKVSDTEKEKLEKRAKMYTTLAKVALIVGAVLFGIGVLAPLALTPLFFIIPEVIALGVIAGCTIGGIAGAISMIVNPILKNCQPVREHRAKTDEDFQKFIDTFVQGPKDTGINFNIKEEDLDDSKLHQVYLNWKKDIEEALSDKQQEKLAKE